MNGMNNLLEKPIFNKDSYKDGFNDSVKLFIRFTEEIKKQHENQFGDISSENPISNTPFITLKEFNNVVYDILESYESFANDSKNKISAL